MSKRKKWSNWYDRKWKNPRALAHRARRAKKYTLPDASSDIERGGEFEDSLVGELIGVVAEVQKFYCVVMYEDTYVRCEVPDTAVPPTMAPLVVGDRVTFDFGDERGVVRQVLPRATKLVRMREDRTRRSEYTREEHVLAANVDIAVIVASAAAPPFHPRLIDRYLVMCQYGNVSPIICINKIDLVAEPPDLTIYESLDIPVVYMSAATGHGLEDLLGLVHGKYSLLTGHSGVGKSTIINRLLNEEVLHVREVGGKHGRGRHTTSVSTLHKLSDSTYLIDTPGIRSMGLWRMDRSILRFYFPEFQEHSLHCKFRDCLHVSEPGCAVKDAVSRGEIPEERYDSYLRMMED